MACDQFSMGCGVFSLHCDSPETDGGPDNSDMLIKEDRESMDADPVYPDASSI